MNRIVKYNKTAGKSRVGLLALSSLGVLAILVMALIVQGPPTRVQTATPPTGFFGVLTTPLQSSSDLIWNIASSTNIYSATASVTQAIADARKATTDQLSSTVRQTTDAAFSFPSSLIVTVNDAISKTVQPTTATQPLDTTFGISMGNDLYWETPAEINATFNDLAALGVGWVRHDLAWSDIQSTGPDTYNWSRYDVIVAAANAHHIRLLPIITYTPRWARPAECDWDERCAPRDPREFAVFAREAAKRYIVRGIHHWEIWNEPNIRKFWKPSPDAGAYTDMLSAAYVAISGVDSSATVITGGLSPAASDGVNIAPVDFIEGMYAAGAKGAFDAVGFHPYSFPDLATAQKKWNAWFQMAGTNPSVRSVMAAHGDAEKKIWLTEYGAPTAGPRHVSEDLQRAILKDSFTAARSLPWAGPLFWYSYKDLGTDESTSENFYGLIRYDGSHKPAYDALKALISAAGKST